MQTENTIRELQLGPSSDHSHPSANGLFMVRRDKASAY